MWFPFFISPSCIRPQSEAANLTIRGLVHTITISVLATGGKDKRLGFVDSSGKIIHIQKKAH